MFKPDETIVKLLISSPSKIVSEYESEKILIANAFLNVDKTYATQITENPNCRNYYILVLRTKGEISAYYKNYGDIICTYLSILFGKRFDNHGCLEQFGVFFVPDIDNIKPLTLYYAGWNNHKPRCDLGIELNFENFKLVDKLLNDDIDEHFKNVLNTAGNFYLQALRMFEEEPEIAFINLVTCGEVLSNYFDYSEEDIYDQELKAALDLIEKEIDNGTEISKLLKKRLYQIKKKYTITMKNLLNDYFFQNTESMNKVFLLKKDDIETRIKSSYDLRSKYLHTGIKFGTYLFPINNLNEIQIGVPNIKDKELKKAISNTPTIIGYERIIRFCLLRFIHQNGITIDNRLD